ncbi:MAG: AAA family ATPase, partial [Saprospiraceae bacterium]
MYIKQLEFENFRRFKHLKMDLPFDEEGNPLPVVLIGVNGSGKSSVLEGI